MRPHTATVLIVAAIVLSSAAAAAGLSALIVAAGQASRERQALIRFVCESVRIREETNDPAAPIFRQRFHSILADLGYSQQEIGKLRASGVVF